MKWNLHSQSVIPVRLYLEESVETDVNIPSFVSSSKTENAGHVKVINVENYVFSAHSWMQFVKLHLYADEWDSVSFLSVTGPCQHPSIMVLFFLFHRRRKLRPKFCSSLTFSFVLNGFKCHDRAVDFSSHRLTHLRVEGAVVEMIFFSVFMFIMSLLLHLLTFIFHFLTFIRRSFSLSVFKLLKMLGVEAHLLRNTST